MSSIPSLMIRSWKVELFNPFVKTLANSTNDLSTTFCIFVLHVTKFPPRKVQYLEVDLLSTKDLA
ncbi:hypothetical protein CR513_12447, partial [Mucuna pruriens]